MAFSFGLVRVVLGLGFASAAVAGAQAVRVNDSLLVSVRSAQGSEIRGARVSLYDRTNLLAQGSTSEAGKWLAVFSPVSSSIRVSVNAIGFLPSETLRKDEKTVEVTLSRAPSSLARVSIVARLRQRPMRPDQTTREIGVPEQAIGFGAVGVSDQGDIAASAAAIPGVSLVAGSETVPASFSVLGLPGDRNVVLFDGMRFAFARFPRDANVRLRVQTASYDGTRGGFSGGLVSVVSVPGSTVSRRLLHVSLDDPAFQATDEIGRVSGRLMRTFDLSGMASGAFKRRGFFYNAAGQFGVRSNGAPSLVSAGPIALSSLGIPRDTLMRLLAAFTRAGIPLSTSSGRDRVQAQAVGNARLDFLASERSRYWMVVSTQIQSASGLFTTPFALATQGSSFQDAHGFAYVANSRYTGGGVLLDTRLGLSGGISRVSATSPLPSGRVVVSAGGADGSTASVPVAFGGSSSAPQATQSFGVEGVHSSTWKTRSATHEFKLGASVRLNALSIASSANLRGTYAFASAADIELARPAVYTRVLQPLSASERLVWSSLSLTDAWSAATRLKVLASLRAEHSRPLSSGRVKLTFPRLAIDEYTTGPSQWSLSPRIGFELQLGTRTVSIPNFPSTSSAMLRGGIGLYQGEVPVGSLAQREAVSTARTSTCFGNAIPELNWGARYDAVPGECPSSSALSAPQRVDESAFGRDFRAPRSWRANLSWDGAVTHRLRAGLDVTSSLDSNIPTLQDLNFSSCCGRSLPDEGGRGVYFDFRAAELGRGNVSTFASRRLSEYGSVWLVGSKGLSQTTQFTASVSDSRADPRLGWSLFYTWRSQREKLDGFSSSTSGDPNTLEWGRGAGDSRHQATAILFGRFSSFAFVTLLGRINSGVPFTPMIESDISGDGIANDRAFIPPATVTPVSQSGALDALLAAIPPRLQSCIRAQAGRVVSRGSCIGPITTNIALQIGLNSERVGLSDRLYLSFGVSNLFTGLGQLIGSPSIRGLGQVSTVDPVLLRVSGFDSARGAFLYRANPTFGGGSGQSSLLRNPFRVSVEARYTFGEHPKRVAVRQILGGVSSDTTANLLEQVASQYRRLVLNPAEIVLQLRDSLALSAAQRVQIEQIAKDFRMRGDSIFRGFASSVVMHRSDSSSDMVSDEFVRSQRPLFSLIGGIGERLRPVLTAQQRRRLPTVIALLMYRESARNLQTVLSPNFGASFFRDD